LKQAWLLIIQNLLKGYLLLKREARASDQWRDLLSARGEECVCVEEQLPWIEGFLKTDAGPGFIRIYWPGG
jgi:hypothetical protein